MGRRKLRRSALLSVFSGVARARYGSAVHYVESPGLSDSRVFASGCRFCAQLREADPEASAQWSPVRRGEHLLAVPSIGPLLPGWLLVLPTSHELSFADFGCDTTVMAELEEIAAWWAGLFGPLTWFEHGPVSVGSPVGCGVDHAHMHLVPLEGLDLLALARSAMPSLRFESIGGADEISRCRQAGAPYLYLRSESGQSWLASSRNIPSQFFRQLIAAAQGRPGEFDWKTHPHHETLSCTLRRARQILAS
jgi:ATP adenylyltransferase